jgi:hypothetical protein
MKTRAEYFAVILILIGIGMMAAGITLLIAAIEKL